MSRDKLFAAALALPEFDRVELVNELAQTLEAPPLTKTEEDGILLALRQIDEGKTVPGDVVHTRLRAIIRKGRTRTSK